MISKESDGVINYNTMLDDRLQHLSRSVINHCAHLLFAYYMFIVPESGRKINTFYVFSQITHPFLPHRIIQRNTIRYIVSGGD
jgi:hypothetical protein